MNIKNLMAIAIVSLIAISGINSASAWTEGFVEPEPGVFYFDLISNYNIEYSVTYFYSDGSKLPGQYQIVRGPVHVCDFSRSYGAAVQAGAKTVEIFADPYTCVYDGSVLYSGPIVPVYMNFWGYVAAGGHPHCDVSWRDSITNEERQNMVFFP